MVALPAAALISGMTGSGNPQQQHQLIEHVLYGSIPDPTYSLLIDRLKGCCDKYEDFADLEIVYVLGPLASNSAPISLRLRRSCLPSHQNDSVQIKYQSMNDNVKDKSKPTVTRSIISVAASKGASKFLEDLGFRPDFHFIARGLVFRKDRIRVTVNRVYKTETYNKESFADKDIQLLTTNWLVEASAIAPSNVPQDEIADELKTFADNLKPLVALEKIDAK